ncbi:hypothetical protein LTR37_013906 [Vermiconidia calcicola]|uniref:Uncharacterized protein n=1 Tax=Vermiconidia calcicola TaxID=1690605 RepID=A0ACC3MV85_9PEZI|nr:hypothetical protein LTR37_013906 [Vermiconidia calcicola]
MPRAEFFYVGGENTEDVHKYEPGGYHPVLLGDVLPKDSAIQEPRYRIMQKLGRGSFATVWLARDVVGSLGFVALKIGISRVHGINNENRILRWLQDTADEQSSVGSQAVIGLLDDFVIQGPNGTHDCTVTEVLGTMRDFRTTPAFSANKKNISLQLLQGVFYLHEKEVAHADLHLDNLGVSLPQLQDRSEGEIMDHFANPECAAVIARDPRKPTHHLPPYLVDSISIIEYLTETHALSNDMPVRVKIMDFGNAFRDRVERPPPNTPIHIRAPEVSLCELSNTQVGGDWDHRVDIWATACTLYEMIRGIEMIYGVGGKSVIYEMVKLAGPLPPSWMAYWDVESFENFRAKHDESAAGNPDGTWARSLDDLFPEEPRRRYLDSKQDTEHFIDLLRKMLKIDPSDRPPIASLLDHPWFTNS